MQHNGIVAHDAAAFEYGECLPPLFREYFIKEAARCYHLGYTLIVHGIEIISLSFCIERSENSIAVFRYTLQAR